MATLTDGTMTAKVLSIQDVSGKVDELKTNLNSLLKVVVVDKDITNDGYSIGSITAPDIEGYKFLAWIYAVSNGFVSLVYVNPPENKVSSVWTSAQTGTKGHVAHCLALYVRTGL